MRGLWGFTIEHDIFTECRNVAISQNQLQSEIQVPLLGHYVFSYLFPFACGCFISLLLNTSFLFRVDDYGLSRSQILSLISLAEVIPRVSVPPTSSSKILRKGLITCLPLYQELWPATEFIRHSHGGFCSDFDGGGRVSKAGQELWKQTSFWFSKVLIKVLLNIYMQYIIKC